MKDTHVCSWSVDNPARRLNQWQQSSPIYFVAYPKPYVVRSLSITAPSSLTTTDSISSRCVPFSVMPIHRGKRVVSRTPSVACVEVCQGKLIWPHSPMNTCSHWFVPIITLQENVLTTKLRLRSLPVTCCTSNVNPPTGFRRYDGKEAHEIFNELRIHETSIIYSLIIRKDHLSFGSATRRAKD